MLDKVILRGANVLGAGVRDLHLAGGAIVAAPASEDGWRVVDCAGLVALPALVDPHTHLRDPGDGLDETMDSGCRAAVTGGYGAVYAMANTTPVADNVEVIDYEIARAAELDICDVHPVGAVTVGLAGQELADLAGMIGRGVRIFSDDGMCVARSDLMRDALLAIREVDGVLAQHSQDPLLTAGAQVDDPLAEELEMTGWPGMAESSIIARDAIMANYLGARVHVCHLSTAESVAVVRWAKQMGYPVTAEATPHHLYLDHGRQRGGDPVYKVNPPLRSTDDVAAVRQGVLDGTIDMIGTDHAPHGPHKKSHGWCVSANGMLGLETALAVVAEVFVVPGLLSWAQLAEKMSDNPAALLRLDDQGADLQPGRVASICLIDPDRQWTARNDDLASISNNQPMAGETFSTRPVATIVRGRVRYDLDQRFAQ